MSDQKWTPGPWRVCSVPGGWDGVCEEANPRSIICNIALNNPANAYLIAAAPDLYDTLEDLLGWQTTAPDSVVDAARAALAKARGES